MTRPKKLLWLPISIVLILGGLTALTGSPIPMWHFEKLEGPVVVKSATPTHLILEDGRELTLPLIVELPNDNPLFQAAIANGVEIQEDGSVYGLIWLDRNCGLDFVVWRTIRVNLSDLAGALHPAGIDSSIVHPDAIAFLAEHKGIEFRGTGRSHKKGHLTLWDHIAMRGVREQFEHSAKLAKSDTPGASESVSPTVN